MKYNINLFTADLLPLKQRLSLGRTLGLSLTLLLITLLGFIGLEFRLTQQQALVESGQLQQQQLTDQLTQVSSQLSQHKPDPALIYQLTELERDLTSLTDMSQLLNQDQRLIQPAFSHVLRDFARSANQEVWLTEFSIEGEKLLLKGEALNGVAVPGWLERLGEEPGLRGRRLTELQINSATQGAGVSFRAEHGLKGEQG